jgi:hypothetical protein
MPVFYYLSQDEAADVYLYLTQYPPLQSASSEFVVLGRQDPISDGGRRSTPGSSGSSSLPSSQRSKAPQANGSPDLETTLVLLGIGGFVTLLLVGDWLSRCMSLSG